MTDPHESGRSNKKIVPKTLTADLAQRIERARANYEVAEKAAMPSATRDMSALSRGLRLGSEFMAAILVGAVMGYLLDQGLGTSPWLLLVMCMVGFAAGVMNVVRASAAMNRAASLPTDGESQPTDDKDE